MTIVNALLDVVLPRHCLECGFWIRNEKTPMLWCPICRMHWPDLRGSVGRILMQERVAMEWGQVGFRLREAKFLEEQVRRFKYQGDYWLAWHWGRWLALGCEAIPQPKGRLVLVPIPLHWRRKCSRGYNQSEGLARGIASVWDLPVDCHLLKRTKSGASLTGLSRLEREKKLQKTYVLSKGNPESPRCVILVDDVLTTGTTMGMCAEALQGSGHHTIGAMALALA